MAESMQTWFK